MSANFVFGRHSKSSQTQRMFGFADTKAAGSAVNSVTPTIKDNTPVDKLARFQEKLEASTGVDKAIQEEIMRVSGNQSVIPCVISSKVSS